MKKRFLRAIALGMTMVVAFSVTGCKSDKEETAKEAKKESETQSDYGYQVEFLDLKSNGYTQAYAFDKKENRVFYSGESYNADGMTGTAYIKSFDIAAEKEQKTIISYDVTENTYVAIPYIQVEEGKLTFLKQVYSYSEEDFTDDTDEELSGDWENISKDEAITETYLDQLGIDLESVGLVFDDVADMTVGEVMDMYEALLTIDEEGDGGYEEDSESYLVTIDEEGKEIASVDVSEAMKDIYPNSIVQGKDGRLYMFCEYMFGDDYENWEYQLNAIDVATGKVEKNVIEVDDMVGISVTGEGQIVGVFYNEDGRMYVDTWNEEKKEFSGNDENTLSGFWIESMYQGEGDSFFYVVDNTLYHYDLSDKKEEKLMKFLDWNVSGDYYPWIGGNAEKLYVLSEQYDEENSVTLNIMTRVAASEIAEKTQITLGCLYASEATKSAVVDFNKSSSNYKILIKEYLTMAEAGLEEYEAVIAEFNNDILSGKGPDIIDLSSVDVATYAGKGLFEDLYTYIEKDSEFSKKNLNQNVLKLFEKDGKLCALPATYSLSLLASDKSLLGDSPLTIEKFEEVVKANADKEILYMTGRETVLAMLYANNKDVLVDKTGKTCNFTDGTFEHILNICAQFESEEEMDFDYENVESEPKKISEGSLLFYSLHLYEPQEYQIANLLFKNGCNITGFPSVDGNAISVSISENLFAINANSKYKDSCWEFIKMVFENSDTSFDFPVDNDKLDMILEEACTPNMDIDENGNEVEFPSVYGWNEDFELEIYAMKEEEAEELKTLLNSVTALSPGYDEDEVYEIIMEEASGFFEGEQTAAEVCDIVQSRVDIFINEDN